MWKLLALVLVAAVAWGAGAARHSEADGSPANASGHVRFTIETRPGRVIDALWQGKKRVGRLLQAPRKVGRRGAYVAVVALALPQGRIFVADTRTSSYDEDNRVAVLGGTGAYADAGGTGVLDYSGTVNFIELDLR